MNTGSKPTKTPEDVLRSALVRIRDWDGFRHTGQVRDCADAAIKKADKLGMSAPEKENVPK